MSDVGWILLEVRKTGKTRTHFRVAGVVTSTSSLGSSSEERSVTGDGYYQTSGSLRVRWFSYKKSSM